MSPVMRQASGAGDTLADEPRCRRTSSGGLSEAQAPGALPQPRDFSGSGGSTHGQASFVTDRPS